MDTVRAGAASGLRIIQDGRAAHRSVERRNDKVRTVDLAKLVDDSFVKSALDRGLLK